MSAPPLPEVFGNYALGDFVEVVSPPAISWLPATSGWLWLGAILAVLLVRLMWRKLRHWYRNRYRREALARLEQLAQTADSGQLVVDLNELLKLTALARWSRSTVASLSGDDWVAFLNRACESPPFGPQLTPLLASGAYTNARPDAVTGRELVAASRTWIAEHGGPENV